MIQKTAIRTKREAGPSVFDADNWQRILGSNVFVNHSSKLRKFVARMTRKLCSQKEFVIKVWKHSTPI